MTTGRRVKVAFAVLSAALVAWTFWAATFDKRGDFEPTADPDVIIKRIGQRVNSSARQANRTAKKSKRKLDGPQKQNSERVRQYKKHMNDVNTN